ncbi:hypothetical protein CPC08DRAFT_712853 [Agrocybe pediades]|nr:hypothetical protein CPC08DRAFT_712853 [Agrocybe pediades]
MLSTTLTNQNKRDLRLPNHILQWPPRLQSAYPANAGYGRSSIRRYNQKRLFLMLSKPPGSVCGKYWHRNTFQSVSKIPAQNNSTH